jgi:hypothetical protein
MSHRQSAVSLKYRPRRFPVLPVMDCLLPNLPGACTTLVSATLHNLAE